MVKNVMKFKHETGTSPPPWHYPPRRDQLTEIEESAQTEIDNMSKSQPAVDQDAVGMGDRHERAAASKDVIVSSGINDDKMWTSTDIDNLANVKTGTMLMDYSDVENSGRNKLVIVDFGSSIDDNGNAAGAELKVWEGPLMTQKRELLGIPVGIAAFTLDESEGCTSACAVACDDTVYIYVNLKAYAKFTLPGAPILQEEAELWDMIAQQGPNNYDVEVVIQTLLSIRAGGGELTPRSTSLIALTDIEEQSKFILKYCSVPLKRKTSITSIDVLNKSSSGVGQTQCLVVATEIGEVLVLSPKNFSVLEKFQLPAAASHISTQGVYDVEYRIMLACRDGNIYRVKGKSPVPIGIELPSHAVGVIRVNKNIYVGMMNNSMSCYSPKGKREWTIPLPASIVTMTLLSYRARNFKAVAIALANGEVRFYNDRSLLSCFTVEEPVVGMVFGKFGNYGGVLTLATESGTLIFKYLENRIDFTNLGAQGGPPPEQSIKIPVPPKSQLYIDQTKRERDNAMTIHHTFQRDLFRLRHSAARNYVKALHQNLTPVVSSSSVSLRMSTEVRGFGPTFKVMVTLTNTTSRPVNGVHVHFTADTKIYSISNALISPRMLVSGSPYCLSTVVVCLVEDLVSSEVSVVVCQDGKPAPILTSAIAMPIVNNIGV